jgi:excisionase family DNA binding protein
MNTDTLLTPDELAEVLGVPAETLKQWRYFGRGPAFVRVGRHVRYRRVDVNDWVTAQRVDPSATQAV